MADNPISNARRPAETDPKDDDPFAELARIVGFKEEKAPEPEEPVAPVDPDPGLNMESELMRELEIDHGRDAGAPIEQNALPESTFGIAPPEQPEEPVTLPEGPSFFDRPDTPSFEPPTEPVIDAPAEPAFQTSVEPTFEPPVESAFEPPAEPAFEPPVETAYGAPVEPTAPAFEPSAPAAFEPSAPKAFDGPAEPSGPTVEPPAPSTPRPTSVADIFGTPAEAPSSVEPTPAPASDWSPAPSMKIGGPATSLEAELQAAFSALEESGTGPQADEVEGGAAAKEDFSLPMETIRESDEMASAYKAFEENIEAAITKTEMPQASVPDDMTQDGSPEAEEPKLNASEDDVGDVNEMLLAEMMDVEAEAAQASVAADVPFDPNEIAEADDIPETIADLDVPQFEPEEVVPAPSAEADFALPLEEELEALASEASGREPTASPEQKIIIDEDSSDFLEAELGALDGDFDLEASDDDLDAITTDALDDISVDSLDDFDSVDLEDDGEFAIDDEDLSVPEYDAVVETQETGSNRGGLIAAIAVMGIVVVGGAGFYLWNGGLGGDAGSGAPKVIAADTEPVKIKPESPGGKTVPNQDLAVYDRVAGTDSDTSSEQNLVNTTEEPVDVVQRTLSSDSLPLEGRGADADSANKSEDRLSASADGENASGAGSETGAIAPRKVRTLVVRPDGTIVAREPEPAATETAATSANADNGASAGSQSASNTETTSSSDTGDGTRQIALAPATNTSSAVNSVRVTTVPVVNTTPTSNGTSEQNSATGNQNAELPPIDNDLRTSGAVPVPGSKPGGQDNDSQTVASNAAAASQTVRNTPVPEARPANQPVNVSTNTNTAAAPARNTAPSNPGGWVMQISSQPSEAGAQQSYQNLSRRYASIIGGRGFDIQRANIPNKGVYYRVRIPAGSKAQATDLCNQYKAAGGSCFVAR